MPIYEFYCSGCHTIYNFFSSAVDTTAAPACPRCGEKRRLERKPATFATLRHGGGEGEGEGEDADLFGDLDEARLEGAMASIAGELEAAGESEDPRQMARLLRRFGEAAGMEPGPKMEEMLARLEAGEDPDALEEAMGDELGDDEAELADLFRLRRAGGARGRRRPPRLDEELYFL